jgi:hypothetical protein
MADIWMTVDAGLSEVPVNIFPLIDDTDFKSREESVTYNQAGLDLLWNFVTTGGAFTQTAVTPTDTGGNYDWVNQGNGLYTIEIPASGGASINNDTEGFGWFTGYATGILPWRGPVIGFRSAMINNSMINGSDYLDIQVAGINAAISKAVADVLLLRDMSKVEAGEDNGASARTPLDAFRFIRNKWIAAGSTLSVKKENDSTEAWAATLTHDAAAEPITSVDPA